MLRRAIEEASAASSEVPSAAEDSPAAEVPSEEARPSDQADGSGPSRYRSHVHLSTSEAFALKLQWLRKFNGGYYDNHPVVQKIRNVKKKAVVYEDLVLMARMVREMYNLRITAGDVHPSLVGKGMTMDLLAKFLRGRGQDFISHCIKIVDLMEHYAESDILSETVESLEGTQMGSSRLYKTLEKMARTGKAVVSEIAEDEEE